MSTTMNATDDIESSIDSSSSDDYPSYANERLDFSTYGFDLVNIAAANAHRPTIEALRELFPSRVVDIRLIDVPARTLTPSVLGKFENNKITEDSIATVKEECKHKYSDDFTSIKDDVYGCLRSELEKLIKFNIIQVSDMSMGRHVTYELQDWVKTLLDITEGSRPRLGQKKQTKLTQKHDILFDLPPTPTSREFQVEQQLRWLSDEWVNNLGDDYNFGGRDNNAGKPRHGLVEWHEETEDSPEQFSASETLHALQEIYALLYEVHEPTFVEYKRNSKGGSTAFSHMPPNGAENRKVQEITQIYEKDGQE